MLSTHPATEVLQHGLGLSGSPDPKVIMADAVAADKAGWAVAVTPDIILVERHHRAHYSAAPNLHASAEPAPWHCSGKNDVWAEEAEHRHRQ